MNRTSTLRLGLGLYLLGVCLSGCEGSSSGTVAVTGKVTKGGQPVDGAAVTFEPTGADGKAASGTTDASGVYKLTTFVNGDGALPGSYKVKISKFAGSAASVPSAGAEATAEDVDAIYKAMEKQGKNVTDRGAPPVETSKNELAAKFANSETSGLTAEVKPGDTKPIDFDVTEK